MKQLKAEAMPCQDIFLFLDNEILVTKIKSVYDCEKQINIMNTRPPRGNLMANLPQQ